MNKPTAVPAPTAPEVNARAVSRKEAAGILGVSEKTVERLIDRGALRAFKVGWQWRMMLNDLNAYIVRQQGLQEKRLGA